MSIEDELLEISKNIHTPDAQLKLQLLLSGDLQGKDLSVSAQSILFSIKSALSKSLLESELYHKISAVKYQAESEGLGCIAKSVLDGQGRFIWNDRVAKRFFTIQGFNPLSRSLFSLMNAKSIRYLYSKFSNVLLGSNKQIVISYILNSGLELTSRCSSIVYTAAPGGYKRGVYLETRAAKHKVLGICSSLRVSPLFDMNDHSQLFTPIQISPASLMQYHEICFIDLENLRITPFLKTDSPQKKRKNEDLQVSYF
jgi:hypothetical protein